MLVLSRQRNESIMIGDDIKVMIVRIDKYEVRIGIEAPEHIPIHREEVLKKIQAAEAATDVETES